VLLTTGQLAAALQGTRLRLHYGNARRAAADPGIVVGGEEAHPGGDGAGVPSHGRSCCYRPGSARELVQGCF
jgi:hypothetical protein